MGIQSIVRDWGRSPSIVRIFTTDTISVATTTGYLFAQSANLSQINAGAFQWSIGDLIALNASDGDGLYQISSDFQSIVVTSDSAVEAQEVQRGAFNNGIDAGVADAYAVALSPVVTTYTNGLLVSFTPTNDNATTTPTLSVNGLPGKTIVLSNDGPVAAGDLSTGSIAYLIYSLAAGEFILLTPVVSSGGGVTAAQVQQGAFNVGLDTGTADAYEVNLSPAISTYTNGLIVIFSAANTNTTGSPTLEVNGMGALPMYPITGVSTNLLPGDIHTPYNTIAVCLLGSFFIVLNPFLSTPTQAQIQNNAFNYAPDTGSANAYAVTLSPVPTLQDGLSVLMLCANSNTGDSTLNANSISDVEILTAAGDALAGGELIGGNEFVYEFIYANGSWILQNPSAVSGGGPVTADAVQASQYNLGVDTGAADAYVVSLTPPITGFIKDGTVLNFIPLNDNATITPTVDVDGLGAKGIVNSDGSSVLAGAISTTTTANMIFNTQLSAFLLINPVVPSFASVVNVQSSHYNYGTDTGAADAYVVALNPPVAGPSDGMMVAFRPTNTNITTTPTLNIGGGAIPMVNAIEGAALAAGNVAFTYIAVCIYSQAASKWLLLTPSA